MSYHSAKFGGHRHSGSRDMIFVSHDFARPRDEGVVRSGRYD